MEEQKFRLSLATQQVNTSLSYIRPDLKRKKEEGGRQLQPPSPQAKTYWLPGSSGPPSTPF